VISTEIEIMTAIQAHHGSLRVQAIVGSERLRDPAGGDDDFFAAAAIRKKIGKALNQTYAETSPAPHPP